MLRKCTPLVRNAVRRSSLWRPARSNFDILDRIERDFRDMERLIDRSFRFRPFLTMMETPMNFDRFNWEHPIVEENGQKKFKLTFDVAQFSPTEVEVKTSKGKLIVQAKHESESKEDKRKSKLEYYRELAIPDGVKLDDLTCKYTENGNLLIEAPYNPPAVEVKEQQIPIKHE